jgi:hypothetical protein
VDHAERTSTRVFSNQIRNPNGINNGILELPRFGQQWVGPSRNPNRERKSKFLSRLRNNHIEGVLKVSMIRHRRARITRTKTQNGFAEIRHVNPINS